jgi:hypothetical protein
MRRYNFNIIGLAFFALLFSCQEENYEPATITFYPTLAGAMSEPEEGKSGATSTVTLLTSRVMSQPSQVNIRIRGNGAGYGYSYVTNPPQLEPGIVTLTFSKGENSASFTFTPLSDGISECDGYLYEFEIVEASKSIKSIGNSTFKMEVVDSSPGIYDLDFEDCNTSPVGLTEVKAAGETVMQANTIGCTSFGYPDNNPTRALEANAFGKGAGVSNSYAITGAIDISELDGFCVSALVYSRFTGSGGIKFLYSTTYSGTGNPEAEGVVWNEMTDINTVLPSAGSQVWKAVNAVLTNVSGSTVYVAIQYKGGTTSSASSWRVDELKIKGF